MARSLPFAPPAPYTRGAVYTRNRIRTEPYTHGAVYTQSRIHTEPYTHGGIYTRSRICMEAYMHGAIYTWSRICMEPYTCGASSLPLLPACSPCSLELSWGLRKPPAHSPCFQLTTLAPSLLSLLPEYPWVPGTSLTAGSSSLQLAPSWLPMANEQFSMYWDPHHLWVARG